jgi:hypothetical protein
MIMNKYFDLYWENPLTTYNKIKKYFKPLKPKIYFDCYRSSCAKILEFNSFDILWKDKYDSPRHERNPIITISLFNYIHIRIEFVMSDDSLDDMVYWEAALYWLYYNLSLSEAIDEAVGWSHYNKETNEYELIKFELLKEPWQNMYVNKELKEIMYESTTR